MEGRQGGAGAQSQGREPSEVGRGVAGEAMGLGAGGLGRRGGERTVSYYPAEVGEGDKSDRTH